MTLPVESSLNPAHSSPHADEADTSVQTLSIMINGDAHYVHAQTLAALVVERQLAGKRIAIELNGSLVPKSRFATTALKEGDRVEIVHAVGGG